MPKLETDIRTTLSPEQAFAALTDFSERRSQMWTGISPELYELISLGETEAVVKEGTAMGPMKVWAIEHYEWSQPGRVKWTVRESNFSTPGSYVQADLSPDGSGGTVIHITWEREASKWWAKPILSMIAASKGKPLEQSARKGLANYEREAGRPNS